MWPLQMPYPLVNEYINDLAVRIEGENEGISNLAESLFHELSKKG